jgi:hypothetical protein
MEGISVSESSKAKRAPKVLHHLEIHPQMGGGVRVEHHHADYQHKMEPHEFEEHEGTKFHEHLTKHTGLAHEEIEEQGGSEPESYK